MPSQRGEVASLIARALVFCKPVANEPGQTRLAWLLTCLDNPPFAMVEARRAPRSEVPHRDKQLKLYRKWDAVQSLYLLPATESEVKYRCGLFSVYKSDTVDRQILNPIPENSRSFSLSDATLVPCLFADASVRSSRQNILISLDNLKDFCHAFIVSDQRAARNHIHGVFRGSDFVCCHAYRPELDDPPVVGCFRTLAMGTNFAVETAQQCHTTLLQRAGCLKPSEQVQY